MACQTSDVAGVYRQMKREESTMTGSLAMQLVIATAMAALTVVMHLLGLSVLIAATNRHSSRLRSEQALARQMLVLVGVSFGLFILHGIEIWSYATLYFLVGATLSFADALYFSTATYATIGDRDLISKSWRVLGAIEGVTASSCWAVDRFLCLNCRADSRP